MPVTKRLEPSLRLPSSSSSLREAGGGPLLVCQPVCIGCIGEKRTGYRDYRERRGRWERRCGRVSCPCRDAHRAVTGCDRARSREARLRARVSEWRGSTRVGETNHRSRVGRSRTPSCAAVEGSWS